MKKRTVSETIKWRQNIYLASFHTQHALLAKNHHSKIFRNDKTSRRGGETTKYSQLFVRKAESEAMSREKKRERGSRQIKSEKIQFHRHEIERAIRKCR